MKKKLPKIKPCPAGHHKAYVYSPMQNAFGVWCDLRDCWHGPWATSELKAILAWNKRA